MSTLKGMMYSQFANDGLANLVAEMQKKYKPKRGRRFNHGNITYEIGRPVLKDNNVLEFEISSKIPQDEIGRTKDMGSYFSEIKKILNSEKKKPVSIEMENIVWDSKKDTEKERDYVKLLYQYPLDDLCDEEEIQKRHASYKHSSDQELPSAPGIHTIQGRLVLALVRETMENIGRNHITSLIEANKKVKAGI